MTSAKGNFVLRTFRIAVSAVVIALSLVVGQLQPAAAAITETESVLAFASQQLGKPFRLGETGLRRYDCSGLVYRAFHETGLLERIGGKRRTARGYFKWFRNRGLITSEPRAGDLIVWGRPVSHIGIFVGYDSKGKPLAISALTSGVARHTVGYINLPFRAYLRVDLDP